MAASAMTKTIMPPDILTNLKPEFVAPFVVAVAHPDGPEASGKVYEVGAGYISEIRWERSRGHVFKTDATFTPSAVRVSAAYKFMTPPQPAMVGCVLLGYGHRLHKPRLVGPVGTVAHPDN